MPQYHIKDLTQSNKEGKIVSFCGEPVEGTHFPDITTAINNIQSKNVETTVCPGCAKEISTILNPTTD